MSKLRHLQKLRSGYSDPNTGNGCDNSEKAEGVTATRRQFLVGASSLGLTLAFAPHGLLAESATVAISNRQFEPTVWFSIGVDGLVHVNVAEAEMGQHVGSALARIIAEELEVSWADIRLNYVDSEPEYGYRVTGGSWSMWQNFELLSRAGAAGRQAMVEAGAALLKEPAFNCKAQDSQIVCGDQALSYAEIVQKGAIDRVFSEAELEAFPIKPVAKRKLLGQDFQALDIPDKTQGTAIYGIDADIDGVVYAKPIIPPTRYGSTVRAIDDQKAKSVAGYIRTISLKDPSNTVPGWVMVIAESYHAALQAARMIEVDYDLGESHQISEADIQARARQLLDQDTGSLVLDDDGVSETYASAEQIIEREYTTSTVLHFQLEPVNAVALEKDGRWELHTGNQWQSLALPVYAKALGVTEDKILMKTYLLGGGFGRRLNGDYGVPALLASQALNLPVKMVLTREDDSRFDSPRSASVQRLSMAVNDKQQVVGMQHHAAAGWPTQVMADFFLGTGANGEKFDPFSINGANHWYSVGKHRVRAVSNDLAKNTFRPGWLRSVGPGWTNWALESFMDEVAHKLGIDPVVFRLQQLKSRGRNAGTSPNSTGGANRLANVLKRAARKAQWGKTMPAGRAMGVATTFGQERDMPTWTACIAEVEADRESGEVKLHKLTLVLDAGTIVHPDGALAQTEGAALWGVSMALHEGTQFVQGEVADVNLDSYTPLRMSDVPELDIEFVQSDHLSVGLGEPATTVVAPAIANAIYSAIGARVRHLPIRPDDVKAAMKPSQQG